MVDSAESDRKVHSLITVLGTNNKVVLKASEGNQRTQKLPILVGYTPPMHGESMSPYSQAEVNNLHLINQTGMPVSVGEMATNCSIETNGNVIANKGQNIQILEK